MARRKSEALAIVYRPSTPILIEALDVFPFFLPVSFVLPLSSPPNGHLAAHQNYIALIRMSDPIKAAVQSHYRNQ